jgi:hypothetical protein
MQTVRPWRERSAMDTESKEPKRESFDEWINRKADEYEQRQAERDASPDRERVPIHRDHDRRRDPFAEDKPDRVQRQLEENFDKADVEYRIRYERLHAKFERIFRDPVDAIRRFNAIRESRGEQRALALLERKPNRVSPTKDAFRAYFQHSTRERASATEARTEVREAFRSTKEAEERKRDADC